MVELMEINQIGDFEITKDEVSNLVEEAIEARKNAYAPYSKFKVGAVVVDESGKHYRGVNVENGSFGLTNCAERTAMFTAVTNGMKKVKILCVVADTTKPVSPCGACRQVLTEFADEETIIILGNLKRDFLLMDLDTLIPYRFSL